MNRSLLILMALGVLLPCAALAQDAGYETPEYSGPTARFDRHLDQYRDQESALRTSRDRLQAIQRDRHNDLAVERHNSVRSMRVQDEMQKQREESLRANERYVLKTNQ